MNIEILVMIRDLENRSQLYMINSFGRSRENQRSIQRTKINRAIEVKNLKIQNLSIVAIQ